MSFDEKTHNDYDIDCLDAYAMAMHFEYVFFGHCYTSMITEKHTSSIFRLMTHGTWLLPLVNQMN